MGAEILLETVEFPCEPWVTRGLEILPESGTWTLAPQSVWHLGIKGILSCPRCSEACGILHDMGEKADNPSHLTIKQWHCQKCHFQCRPMLLDWDKRKLYCAAFETLVDGVLKANKEYMHAVDEQDATAQFWNGRIAADNVVKLVGVAPAIGYFVQDTQGRKLTTD